MIYFDFTSSATWGGHPVGIIRVERGMLEGLKERFGDGVQPVIYHQRIKMFFRLRPDIAELLRDRRAIINMDIEVPGHIEALLSPKRQSEASWLKLFESVKDWAGALAETGSRDLCEGWRRHTVENNEGKTANFIPFFSAVSEVLAPSISDTIISAGLDWDNKDLKAIKALKRFNGFSYVQFVYDVVPVRYPQFVVPEIREKIAGFFEQVVEIADYYLFDSETTGREWYEWIEERGFDAEPGAAIPLAIDLKGGVSAKQSAANIPQQLIGKSFAIYVSSVEPRKNHITAYLAWKDAIRSGKLDPKRHALVFVGMMGWLSTDLCKAIEADRELRGSIMLMHGLSDTVLKSLYANARFSIFPSFHEGFGLGLAESLSSGKFAISSDRGALPEVGRDFALYLDPDDIPAWSNAMSLYMTDDEALAARMAHLDNYVTPDWGAAVQPVIDLEIEP